jgi:hypothetical protein
LAQLLTIWGKGAYDFLFSYFWISPILAKSVFFCI